MPLPALASPPGPDAERSRLEKFRGQCRQALDRSCVVQEVDGLAYVLAPESRPNPAQRRHDARLLSQLPPE
jgi:hypothetical protein